MNELSIIEKVNILGLDLNIYGDLENPLFLAKDIAKAIGHSNITKMLEIVGRKDELTSGYVIDTLGRKQEMKLLTENQVYKILMRSDKPIAMEIQEGLYNFLKAWRKKEITVIPAKQRLLLNIIEANNDMSKALAINEYENIYVKPLELENEQQAQKIIELQPKADYCDNILKPNHVFAITHIAKDLGTTPNEVNKILEKLEIQYHGSKLMPWILRAEYDWLVPQYCDYEDFKNDFMKIPVKNLKWSEKGRMWLIETLDQAGYLEWFDGKPRVKKEGKKKCKKQAQIDVWTI